MAEIKMNSDAVAEALRGLQAKISTYRDGVVNSKVQIGAIKSSLEGSAYTSLLGKVENDMERQLLLVAECMTLNSQLSAFTEEISSAEASVSFE
ncbi:hypothetical protein [Streptococcus sp. A22]|uniref:hypothetical protein n=1 Tax=Streptococcus sp. A22 TaxID=3373126 RepID=UPI00298F91C5|nr:hypothetical protein [Streptococcus suis]HEM3705966.1 hypothetical protein [Streptococcus suis]